MRKRLPLLWKFAEVIERGRKDKLAALRNLPKKKVLEETAKFDKVLSNYSLRRLMNYSMQGLLLLQID